VEETKIRDLLTPRVKMYKIVPMRNIKSSVRSEAVSKKAIASVGNLSEVIPDYVATVKAPGLRSKRLITVGRKLVKE
jgi:hypothetical protein